MKACTIRDCRWARCDLVRSCINRSKSSASVATRSTRSPVPFVRAQHPHGMTALPEISGSNQRQFSLRCAWYEAISCSMSVPLPFQFFPAVLNQLAPAPPRIGLTARMTESESAQAPCSTSFRRQLRASSRRVAANANAHKQRPR